MAAVTQRRGRDHLLSLLHPPLSVPEELEGKIGVPFKGPLPTRASGGGPRDPLQTSFGVPTIFFCLVCIWILIIMCVT